MDRGTVREKRIRTTICTYKKLVDDFRKQSFEKNLSMSRRIEMFMINELKKEKKKEHSVV